jgi:hypothetical protein
LYESWYVLLKDALDNGLIKPKHVVLLMCMFNCGGDGFHDWLFYNHPRMLKYRLFMTTVIILSHETQSPVTANDHHTMAAVRTTHTQSWILTHKVQNPLITVNYIQATSFIILTDGLSLLMAMEVTNRRAMCELSLLYILQVVLN